MSPVIFALCVSLLHADPTPDPYLIQYHQTLKQYRIEPTGPAVLDYLRQLHPDAAQQKKIDGLIDRLGDSDFFQRERATADLLAMATIPVAALTKATLSDDPEIRWRAEQVLDKTEGRTTEVLHAALRTLAADPAPKAARQLLLVAKECNRPHLRTAMIDALRKSARPEDAALLREAIKDADSLIRIAAAGGLLQAVGKEKAAEIYPLLEDKDQRTALEVARLLADVGDRKCLPQLVKLLESEDWLVRADASATLSGLTALHFNFSAYDKPEARQKPLESWKNWLVNEGATAKLNFPVRYHYTARGDLRGHTLVATGSNGKILELDETGKTVWSFDSGAWSAEKLTNGNVLIASYTENRVAVVDAARKIVWEYKDLNAMKAKPLLSGNYLVSDFRGKRVVEIDPRSSRIVWESPTPDECFDCDRLPNGNTIFGCPQLIREITPQGATVREYKIEGRLNGFQVQPNGNILVANYGQNRVYELDQSGKQIWSMDESQPCDAYRLANGTLLISTGARIVEVSPGGKQKEIMKANYGSCRR